MLTKLTIRNFKRFGEVEIELGERGNPVVFIGPNNSGKTSALQALALWDVGLKRWNEKRKETETPKNRPGVTINRRDLVSLPIPEANLLWRGLHVRDVEKVGGKQRTQNVFIDIVVEGVAGDATWTCGLEFYYANPESFYCRPLPLSEGQDPARMPIPKEASGVQVAFLPPMSGLSATETSLDPGAINVRIGEGRTAEVLRNLCFNICQEKAELWTRLVKQIESLFGARLREPQYIPERGEIRMSYEENGRILDLSSSGRGLQQTLLLLSYMYANAGAVLLLDEPDAHLEILRQGQTYHLLTEVARKNGNQLIVASHSEVLLNEAAQSDVVVAFVGKPHRINDRGSQVLKALREIGFEHYYQAEQTGWVLYLEGSTDLATLRAFAEVLGHEEALGALERPFVHYVGNLPKAALDHFHGVREAVPHLKGVAVFDRLEQNLPVERGPELLMWERREIENYLCDGQALESFARQSAREQAADTMFLESESSKRLRAMSESIREVEEALKKLDKGSPWDGNVKVSDDFLPQVFKGFFEKLGVPNTMAKRNYHELAHLVPKSRIDPDVIAKLDAIARVSREASPASDTS